MGSRSCRHHKVYSRFFQDLLRQKTDQVQFCPPLQKKRQRDLYGRCLHHVIGCQLHGEHDRHFRYLERGLRPTFGWLLCKKEPVSLSSYLCPIPVLRKSNHQVESIDWRKPGCRHPHRHHSVPAHVLIRSETECQADQDAASRLTCVDSSWFSESLQIYNEGLFQVRLPDNLFVPTSKRKQIPQNLTQLQ